MAELAINSIRLDKRGLNTILSELEGALLNFLWENGPSTVRTMYEKIGEGGGLALTTIAVTLDRMHSRGLTKRELSKGRGGLKYIYSAGATKEEIGKSLARTIVKKLSGAFGSSFASYFDGMGKENKNGGK